jgi:hypothetical protein
MLEMQLLFKRLYYINKKETLSVWLQGTHTNSFMMSMAFWVETPCSLNKTHRLEGKYRLHLQDERLSQATKPAQTGVTPRFLPDSLFDPTDGNDMFLRNVWLSELYSITTQKIVLSHSDLHENL